MEIHPSDPGCLLDRSDRLTRSITHISQQENQHQYFLLATDISK